jgi:uncharacterized protein (DUF1501 family)
MSSQVSSDEGDRVSHTDDDTCACDRSGDRSVAGGPTRRTLLRAAAAAGVLGVVTGAVSEGVTTRYAFAGSAGGTGAAYTGDVLVVLSLRGGFDGLGAIVPAGDPDYLRLRPTIGLPVASLLPLTGIFGLHPALAPLLPLWTAGHLAVVHAVGQEEPSRSHFTAMAELERAAPGTSLRTGWLDRAVGLRAPGDVFQAAQVGSTSPAGALAGPVPELTMGSIDAFDLWGAWDGTQRALWTKALGTLHRSAPAGVRGAATKALQAVGTTSALAAAAKKQPLPPGYPEKSGLAQALHDVVRLVKARVGVQVACVDFGDWDMHAGMGGPGSGALHDHLDELARSLAAFAADLGPLLDGVTLVTLSEFGRRAFENGNGGADHGHGNAVLLLGGGVAGGAVYGRWPGLADADLVDGDLAGTTDYRQVLAEILVGRCGLQSVGEVFPGLVPAPLGVVRVRPDP